MKIYLSIILACVLAIPLFAEAGPGSPPPLDCEFFHPDCVTETELNAAVDDLQGQIDDIELTPGLQGEQGIQGVAGNDGNDGEDADMSAVNANTSGVAQNRSLINDNAEEIEWLKGEVADARDEMRDGLSQVAATGIIPDSEPGKFGVGIGCASYKSNDNCALGLAWTANDGRYKLKAAATEDVVSIGGMYSF